MTSRQSAIIDTVADAKSPAVISHTQNDWLNLGRVIGQLLAFVSVSNRDSSLALLIALATEQAVKERSFECYEVIETELLVYFDHHHSIRQVVLN